MTSWQWSVVLRPLGSFIIMAGIVAPIRWAIMKPIKNEKVRRFLLKRLN
ncbi:MAG TPA: hypothetical protein VN541_10680 [Tepidisphaeraceae bacterium]|nr:hypothetical protein [Tepidisphaeraceae bacterium]